MHHNFDYAICSIALPFSYRYDPILVIVLEEFYLYIDDVQHLQHACLYYLAKFLYITHFSVWVF